MCAETGLTISQVSNWMINVSRFTRSMYLCGCYNSHPCRLDVAFSHLSNANASMSRLLC